MIATPGGGSFRNRCPNSTARQRIEDEGRQLLREFRAAGPIGSGPTEACGKTPTQRLKGSGMRWGLDDAEALMALESLRRSDLWKKYGATRLPPTT